MLDPKAELEQPFCIHQQLATNNLMRPSRLGVAAYVWETRQVPMIADLSAWWAAC
jgi:hypothetical protein